jgi:type II secretory pathway component PulL
MKHQISELADPPLSYEEIEAILLHDLDADAATVMPQNFELVQSSGTGWARWLFVSVMMVVLLGTWVKQ